MIDLALSSRLDRIITLLEARETLPDTSAPLSSNGFDWVRQLELAFSMICGSKAEVHGFFNEHRNRGTIAVSFEARGLEEVDRATNLIRQVFDQKIVQDVSRSTPHNKIGVA